MESQSQESISPHSPNERSRNAYISHSLIDHDGLNQNLSYVIDAGPDRKHITEESAASSHFSQHEYGCKIFVGQIPKEMDEEDLRPYLEGFGLISEISIIRERDRETGAFVSKGCAFVTFAYPESVEAAVEKLHDKTKLPNSQNTLQVRVAETQIERENKLFVGMLPKTASEQDLTTMFCAYGDLREVHIIRGPEGGSKGCAFVKFHDKEAAVAAIQELHDSIPMGATRPLVVKFADNKKQARQRTDEDAMTQQFSGMLISPPQPQDNSYLFQQQRMMYSYPPAAPPPHQQFSMVQTSTYTSYAPQHHLMSSKLAPPPHYPLQHPMDQQRYFGGSQGAPRPVVGQFSYGGVVPGYSSGNPSTVQPSLYHHREEVSGSQAYSHMPRQDEDDDDDDEEEHDMRHQLTNAAAAAPSEKGGLDTQGSDDGLQPIDTPGQHVRPPEGPAGANLFIYHLPRDLTDADLATLFAPFGNVISAKVFVDKKTSDSKGFGFVSYDVLSSANSAIESMNGFQIGSKRLKVQHKRVGYIGGVGGGSEVEDRPAYGDREHDPRGSAGRSSNQSGYYSQRPKQRGSEADHSSDADASEHYSSWSTSDHDSSHGYHPGYPPRKGPSPSPPPHYSQLTSMPPMPYTYSATPAYPVGGSVGYRQMGMPVAVHDPVYSSAAMAHHRGQQRLAQGQDDSEFFPPTATHSHGRGRRGGGGERERAGDRDAAHFRDRQGGWDSNQQQHHLPRRGQEYPPSAYPPQYQQQQQQQQQIYRSVVGNPHANPQQQQRLFNPNSGDRYGRDDNYRDSYM